jgi:hypothetical protein
MSSDSTPERIAVVAVRVESPAGTEIAKCIRPA